MIGKTFRYGAIIILGLVTVAGSIEAYQWTSEQFSVEYTFGQYSRYGVRKGVGVQASSAEVGVLLPGELVFEQGPDSVLPTKRGYTRVVAHEKEELLSVYAGLTSLDVVNKGMLTVDDLVGSLVPERGGLYDLYVFDLRLQQYVNPMVFLPAGFAGGVPLISSVFLVYNDGEMIALRSGSSVRAGIAEVLLDVHNRSMAGDLLMPKRVDLRLMGDLVSSVELNALVAEQGNTVLVGAKRVLAEELYNAQGLLRLTSVRLFQGQISIVLRATTSDGLEREVAMRFSVVS